MMITVIIIAMRMSKAIMMPIISPGLEDLLFLLFPESASVFALHFPSIIISPFAHSVTH